MKTKAAKKTPKKVSKSHAATITHTSRKTTSNNDSLYATVASVAGILSAIGIVIYGWVAQHAHTMLFGKLF